MRQRFIFLRIAIFSLAAVSLASQAQTYYINDVLFVPLRSGPSSEHRILHKGLKSGTPVELVSPDEVDGWLNVVTEGGLIGWMPRRYLLDSPTSALRLASNIEKLKNLEVENQKLKSQAQKQTTKIKKLEKSLLRTETEGQRLTLELHRIKSISSGAIELDANYQKLLEDHELLQTANDALHAENTSLKSDRRFSYMFYGAMLVVLGMLMAVILPRLKMKKRHSEWVN